MKVLFVDDEPQVLRGIVRMLDAEEVDWDVHTATSGAEALALVAQEPADVVVSDMKMPGMDGATLLEELSENHPSTVRIVLSGQANKESVYRAVSPMHQYLSKPCDSERLVETVSRACAVHELLQKTQSSDFLCRVSTLPSLPEVYQRLVAEIESETGTLKRVGELLSTDPAMTAKILQIANSAIFGARTEITTPVQAASLIGMDALKSLVLSISVFREFSGTCIPGFSLAKLASHSLEVSNFCACIAKSEQLDPELANEAYTAGLLHDVGKLVLASSAPEEYAQALSKSQTDGHDSTVASQVERELFGIGHDGIGGYLLALWGLPQSIVEGVALHHSPEQCLGSELSVSAIVYIANLLEKVDSSGNEDPQLSQFLSHFSLEDRPAVWRSRPQEGHK